ncbi:MAG: ATP-binding protein [Candidatus Diapherotrites archaeon]|nr:ATP-binding protein [Candidatus Diapherotrites archaeon]
MPSQFRTPKKMKQQSRPKSQRHGLDWKLPFKSGRISGQRITAPQRVLFDILRHRIVNPEQVVVGLFEIIEEQYAELTGMGKGRFKKQSNELESFEAPIELTKPEIAKFVGGLRKKVVLFTRMKKRILQISQQLSKMSGRKEFFDKAIHEFNEGFAKFMQDVVPFLRMDFLQPVEIEKLNIAEILKSALESRSANVEVRCQKNLEVFGIEPIFYDVFQSIASNCVEHGQSTRILVVAKEKKGKNIISFFNNGKRIPEALLEKINTPGSFTRTQNEKQGFGTVVARESAEMFGGTYAVENLPDNKAGWTVMHRIVLPKKK